MAVDAAGELPSVHQSVHALKLRSVLAVPLIARGEALGVVYLDDRVRRGRVRAARARAGRAPSRRSRPWPSPTRAIRCSSAAPRAAPTRASAELAETLARARRRSTWPSASSRARAARAGRASRYDAIVGESEPMRAMLELVDRVTAAECRCSSIGESGSGKELVARAIHDNGARGGEPFVSENCGAIPEGLLESALFGHVRGAFTGA